jgi:hypothetical protein
MNGIEIYHDEYMILNLGSFRNLKFLDEIPFKKCVFFYFIAINA